MIRHTHRNGTNWKVIGVLLAVSRTAVTPVVAVAAFTVAGA